MGGAGEALLERALSTWSKLGWGRVELSIEGDRVVARHTDSPECGAYLSLAGKGVIEVEKAPRSWLALNYIWEFLEAFLGKQLKGVEEKCIAKGDDECVYVFSPSFSIIFSLESIQTSFFLAS